MAANKTQKLQNLIVMPVGDSACERDGDARCGLVLVSGLHAKKYKNIYLICIFVIRFIYFIHIIQIFDDNVFAIIKSYCIFLICLCFNMVTFRGQKSLGHAQIGLL